MTSPVDSAARAVILTIGHSNHPFEHFLDLLRRHAITAVADVRSRPYTKYAKHFCREPLERLLRAQSIPYVFLGDLIGGKPDDPSLLGPDGKPDYALIAATPAFSLGIERLITGAATHVIALMCGEEDPSTCHRHHLIAPALTGAASPFAIYAATGASRTTPRCGARQNRRPGHNSCSCFSPLVPPGADSFPTHEKARHPWPWPPI